MAKATTATSNPIVRWTTFTSTGPSLAHHVGCIIGNFLYVHGGIDRRMSNSPLSGLHQLDLTSRTWKMMDAPNSPSLSHHCCVVLQERYMLLIGGWSGKARTSDLYAFDTQENCWTFPKSSGFPVGAGLSSHTATLLSNGNILVLGREGSLRMQRRSGNAFLLSGDISKGVFRYTDCAMGVASRSGHTADILGTTLYVVGGRSDKLVELHSGCKGGPPTSQVLKTIAAKAKTLSPMTKAPCGRKNHVTISGDGVILIHGGETFDGRSRKPVGEMYILQTKPCIQWIKVGPTDVGRAGHVCCNNPGQVLIHGGEGGHGTIRGDTYQLET